MTHFFASRLASFLIGIGLNITLYEQRWASLIAATMAVLVMLCIVSHGGLKMTQNDLAVMAVILAIVSIAATTSRDGNSYRKGLCEKPRREASESGRTQNL